MSDADLEQISKWESAFPPGCYQIEMALDCGIKIGNSVEEYITYEGTTYRWINAADAFHCPVLVFAVANEHDMGADHARVMRLLSRISYDAREPIREFTSVGRYRSYRSMLSGHPRDCIASLVIDPRYLSLHEEESASSELNMAFAFFREGLSASSVYFGFLSFYKVIQLAFQENGADIRSWVAANVEFASRHWDFDKLKARSSGSASIADYLYESGRCAIAHTRLTRIVADPDNWEDRQRIAADLPIVRELARIAIESRVGIFAGRPL